jgi:hypothetical protein
VKAQRARRVCLGLRHSPPRQQNRTRPPRFSIHFRSFHHAAGSR